MLFCLHPEEPKLWVRSVASSCSLLVLSLKFDHPLINIPVNDLGGGMHGDSKASSRPADTVVSLIKSRGGTAVPNYGTITNTTR